MPTVNNRKRTGLVVGAFVAAAVGVAALLLSSRDIPPDRPPPSSLSVAPSAAATAGIGGLTEAVAELPPHDTSEKLQSAVSADGIQRHLAVLQAIADAHAGNRAAGTAGYDASADYVADLLRRAGYDVELQEFSFRSFEVRGPSRLAVAGPGGRAFVEGTDFAVMGYSGGGRVSGPVVSGGNGCDASDFAGFPRGGVALVERGTCLLRAKTDNAEKAGAVGVVIFNSSSSLFRGTLGDDAAATVPVVSTSAEAGSALSDVAAGRGSVEQAVDVDNGPKKTHNVIAQTKTGRADRVVMAGAHLDSVSEGPGIDDNGSGSATILEIALQMARARPVNQVRFAFWGGEELGLLGSQHYVEGLSREQRGAISAYLNFDMVGSPNFGRFVFDGDGSSFGGGTPGSGEVEKVFLDHFVSAGLAVHPVPIGVGSDQVPFAAAGIPVGGLYSGADEEKNAEQAASYGGQEGRPFDPCYHSACDRIDNVNAVVLDQLADGAAHAVITLAMRPEPLAR